MIRLLSADADLRRDMMIELWNDESGFSSKNIVETRGSMNRRLMNKESRKAGKLSTSQGNYGREGICNGINRYNLT